MELHNLVEGLATGASYANGEWVISGLLVTSFALTTARKGSASSGRRAPTCLGTLLSGGESSPYATIVVYTLAAVEVFLGITLMYVSAMVLSLTSDIRS